MTALSILLLLGLTSEQAWGQPASPEETDSNDEVSGQAAVGGFVEDGTPMASVSVTGGREGSKPSPRRRGRAATPRCSYAPLPEGEVVLDVYGRPRAAPAGSGWVVKDCRGPDGRQVFYELAPLRNTLRSFTGVDLVDPVVLARRAVARLPLAAPRVGMSPAADAEQLVNLPTWLWVADAWAPRSATASEAGVSVTVTATPRRVVWEMGDGGRVVCAGPGVPYDLARAEAEQRTDCAYTYRWPSTGQPQGRYPVTATMSWDVRWTAAGAEGGGGLGELSRSTSLSLLVAEGQALVTAP